MLLLSIAVLHCGRALLTLERRHHVMSSPSHLAHTEVLVNWHWSARMRNSIGARFGDDEQIPGLPRRKEVVTYLRSWSNNATLFSRQSESSVAGFIVTTIFDDAFNLRLSFAKVTSHCMSVAVNLEIGRMAPQSASVGRVNSSKRFPGWPQMHASAPEINQLLPFWGGTPLHFAPFLFLLIQSVV
jgi:hypothetical protein